MCGSTLTQTASCDGSVCERQRVDRRHLVAARRVGGARLVDERRRGVDPDDVVARRCDSSRVRRPSPHPTSSVRPVGGGSSS